MIMLRIVLPLAAVAALLSACPGISVPEDICTLYCEKVVESCGTFDDGKSNGQYASTAACSVYCKEASKMSIGSDADTAVNSAECRRHHAGLAALDPDSHCEHAGPTGGGTCGGYCEVYCQLMDSNCASKYADTAACTTACAAFATDGWSNDGEGDSVQCRITYAGLAGAERGSPASQGHCDSAMPDSPLCSAPAECGSFCTDVLSSCTGGDAFYTDAADCNAVCSQASGWVPGVLGDDERSTIGCRHNMAKQAAAETDADAKTQLCKNASETGGDQCGAWCDNWCDLLNKNCSSKFTAFADHDACFSACQAFPVTGNPKDLNGNSLQCRISYAMAAGLPANSGATDTLCASAEQNSAACQ